MHTTLKYSINDIDKLLSDTTRWGIGMDEWVQRFATLQEPQSSYPPYNYIKESETEFRLEFALAGYKPEDVEISTERNVLSITSKKSESEDKTYLHKGLAKRAFTWSRNLSDDVEVKEVSYDNGLLIVKLVKIIPEHQKKKVYSISGLVTDKQLLTE
jgi:molecular chaperone IbpA